MWSSLQIGEFSKCFLKMGNKITSWSLPTFPKSVSYLLNTYITSLMSIFITYMYKSLMCIYVLNSFKLVLLAAMGYHTLCHSVLFILCLVRASTEVCRCFVDRIVS